MRSYKGGDAAPGDPAELDPCLAAEARSSKSTCTTKRLQLIALLVAILLLLSILIFFIVFSAVSQDDLRPAPTDGGPQPLRKEQAPTPLLTHGKGEAAAEEEATAREALEELQQEAVVTMDTPVKLTTEEDEEEMGEDEDEEQNENVEGNDKEEEVEDEDKAVLPSLSTTEELASATKEPTTTTREPLTSEELPTAITEELPETPIYDASDEPPTKLPTIETSTSEFSRVSENIYSDCYEIGKEGMPTGVYTLAPEDEEFDALCDSDTDGGGWTVIQRRTDANTYFYNRSWGEYERGFGDPKWNHWLGLERVRQIVKRQALPLRLRVELTGDLCADKTRCSGHNDDFWWSEWDFTIGGADTNYVLTLSPVKAGNLSTEQYDPFFFTNNGQPFTTIDKDNDKASSYNCAQFRNFGGWWHNDCTLVALNGIYGDDKPRMRYQFWFHQAASSMDTYYIHPRVSVIKIRPQQ